ncbi:hypothetical protein EVAR_68967_1 [Eumeta japonica]|uniref:Uncharacterized protein n=1 Tax=Eumeta variegata TaxID=151549 RepID=A0A4C2A712_EUMVA|nr:hypothetical protein EVAR_68967_1 [Eumeta japonica]
MTCPMCCTEPNAQTLITIVPNNEMERLPRQGPEREEEDTGSLTRAWLSRAPPSTTTPQPGALPPAAERMRNDARAREWPGVGAGLKNEDWR